MNRYVFAVDDRVYCCWDHDLPGRTEQFLSSIDGGYFEYVATRYLEDIEGENKQRAAVALRAAYHHGLETLFSLLGALTQAPEAVPAWIPNCSNTALKSLVRSLTRGDPVLTQRGRQRIRLVDLAELVHAYAWRDELPLGATGERFGQLWLRFASDFLDEHHASEYNSIKHGFRVSSGGFVLRIGEETEFGVRAPEENMHTVGASPFGTRFLETEPVFAENSMRHHIRIQQVSLNWRAEAMVQRLHLISWSVNNVASALRCLNGAEPGTAKFERPADPGAFEAAWAWNVGVHASTFGSHIDPSAVDPRPRPKLQLELESRESADHA